MHCFELVYLIDEGRGYIVVISVNGSANKLAAVVCLEAANDAGIIRLDMSRRFGFEVLNTDIC